MIEKGNPNGPRCRVGLSYMATYTTTDWEDAARFAAGVAEVGRRQDADSWETVVAEASAVSANLPISTLEQHDAAPYVYWGRCTLRCETPALMLKMSVRQFRKFGHYMCTQCGIVYDAGDPPEPFHAKWRGPLGMPR